MRIAINGFGRIGRSFLRALIADKQASEQIKTVVINIGPASIDTVAHMFCYDTIMGPFKGEVAYKDNQLIINGHEIALLAKTDLSQIDWKTYSIDWVVDASGKYTSAQKAREHLSSGAKYVLITAPCKGSVNTIIPGVNDQQFDPAKDHIVSLASCTSNAIMPMLKVIHDRFGILQGFMTTVHAYTNSQVLLDVEASDLRRSRAAALNIIPTSTGASHVIDQVMPELTGHIHTTAMRVPVANVSLIDLVVQTKHALTVDQINNAFVQASRKELIGILGVSDEPLVSSDYIGNSNSVTIDTLLTQVENMTTKCFGWYDNEWGYSERLKDFLLQQAKT